MEKVLFWPLPWGLVRSLGILRGERRLVGSIGILLGGAFTAPCSEDVADNFCIISVL